MFKPRAKRCLCFKPNVSYFKPRGVPLRQLKEVNLRADEMEAIKLHDHDGLTHKKAATAMNVSQPTFSRILDRAYKKVAQALVEGQAIKIDPPRTHV